MDETILLSHLFLPVLLRPIIIHGSDFCSRIRIIPIPSGNLLQQRREKRRREIKKKKEGGGRKRKRNLSFVEGSRIPLSRRMIYQPACPRLFSFSILFSILERKIDGLITVLRSGKEEKRKREREDVSAREATGSTCSLSLLRHCYSTKVAQNTRFPLFVTVSRPSRAYGFALRPRILSICRVEKCLDRVSFSKNFGRLTWQPSKEPTVEGMLRNVGDLFERLNTFPRFINDFNSNYWKERTSRF